VIVAYFEKGECYVIYYRHFEECVYGN